MKSDLIGKLEALKEHKAEYGIGSREAWNYIKTQNELLGLKERISPALKEEGIEFFLTNRETSNLCQHMAENINFIMDTISLIYAFDRGKFHNYHYVKYCCETVNKSKQFEQYCDFVWKFNYEEYLTDIIKKANETQDYGEAFREILGDFFKSDVAYLKDKDGRKYTYDEFLSCGQFLAEYDLTEFENSDLYDLKEYMASELRHLFSWALGAASENPLGDLELSDVSIEEKEFLLGRAKQDLYQRALRERTLKYLWVERRIALNNVLNQCSAPYSKGDIDNLLDRIRRNVHESSKRLELFVSTGAPQVILDNERAIDSKKKYTIHAILANRAWLERVLR